MNLNNPNVSDFVKLLGENDDSIHRRLAVEHNGNVKIVCPNGLLPSTFEVDYKFYYEIWCAGNGYSGKAASEDKNHVQKYYNSLISNWKIIKNLS